MRKYELMTKRLYYDDSHARVFDATVIDRLTHDSKPAVILDHTYFYPTGGGQPHDIGTIDNARVIDVLSNDDGAVIHVLDSEVDNDSVQCRLDWVRRFDHMQHHTGQHILTQAFVQISDAHTVGFHLGADSVTIDLDTLVIADEILYEAEALANQIIQENRPITTRIIDPQDIDDVRMRKMPEKLYTGGLRVVDIANFDLTACGGTHVKATGEIGIIKVIKTEKRGDKTRIEFVCGGRALADYANKTTIVRDLTSLLTCHPNEIAQIVNGLQDDLKQALRQNKKSNERLLDYEAQALFEQATSHNELRIVNKTFIERDPKDLQGLARRLVEKENTLAFLISTGEKSLLLFARAENLPYNMNILLKAILSEFSAGRGGGRPAMAQGGGMPLSSDEASEALKFALNTVLDNT